MDTKKNTSDLIKKVRRIELKTKGLSNQIFSGEYHSAFKGRGMAFSEVREYAIGDEIRDIDWNVTARFGDPFVKVFEEERELTVLLVVDVSGSDSFGTKEKLKKELITEICAVLSFSAIKNNDKVGLIFFTDKVEKFIPPKKGKSHILRIIRELIEFNPENKKTNIAEALRYANKVVKKKSICFLLSDFVSPDFEDALRFTNKKHDLIAVNIYDQAERELPDVGLVPFQDLESGEFRWINSSNKRARKLFDELAAEQVNNLHRLFKKTGVDFVDIATDEDYIIPLMKLFKKRG